MPHTDRDEEMTELARQAQAKQSLWPIFLAEVLAFVLFLPIFALMGMGYAPSLGWKNYLLLTFHLYPVHVFVAFIVANILNDRGKNSIAVVIALLPPLISCGGFILYLLV